MFGTFVEGLCALLHSRTGTWRGRLVHLHVQGSSPALGTSVLRPGAAAEEGRESHVEDLTRNRYDAGLAGAW